MPLFPDVPVQVRNLDDVIRFIQRVQDARSIMLPPIASLPVSGKAGEVVYHNNQFYGWTGSAWVDLGSTVSAGNLTVGTGLSVTGGTGAVIGTGAAVSIAGTHYLPTTADQAAWNAKVSSQWTTSGSDIHYTTGNVGIGTSSPSEKLHVSGTVKATAYMAGTSNGIDATIPIAPVAPYTIAGSLTVTKGIVTAYVEPSS